MKQCSKCLIQKDFSNFRIRKKSIKTVNYNSSCKECEKEDCRTRYKNIQSSDAGKEYNRLRNKKFRKANPGSIKNTWLKKEFGITLEKFLELKQQQNNVCAICLQPETCVVSRGQDKKIRDLSVDHCHKTGKIRALLCSNCNKGIGSLKENIDILTKAIAYLKKYNNE
jgi:hypothetical protein